MQMIAFIINPNVVIYMIDYIGHLQKFLQKNFNIDSEILSQVLLSDKYSHYIFIQAIDENVLNILRAANKQVYLLNTEQMSIKPRLEFVLNMAKKVGFIIDYSSANITILKEQFPEGKYYYWPFPIIFEEAQPKTNDIIALVSSPYRGTLARKVNKRIVNFNGMWGSERDNLIKSSKILLNFHFNENYGILESIRCNHALEMYTLVISQECLHYTEEISAEYIIFIKDDEWDTAVENILTNYDKIFEEKFSKKNKNKINKKFIKTFEKELTEMQLIKA